MWIVGAPDEVDPAKRNAGSFSNAGETGQPSINAHTNKYQYARQSLTKAKPLKEAEQNVICSILLGRNINNVITGNRNSGGFPILQVTLNRQFGQPNG